MPTSEVLTGDAFARTWAELTRHLDGAWVRRTAGAVVSVTGLPVAAFNSVAVWSPGAAAGGIDGHVAELAGGGVPFSLTAPVEAADRYGSVAARHGLTVAGDVPLMVLADAAAVVEPPVPGLSVRRLAPGEIDQHARLAGPALGLPPVVFESLTSPAMAGAGPSSFYVGEVDGRPVTTGLGVTLGPSVAVLNVATAAAHRGRGYGAAVSARVVRDGAAAGAGWAWLQSSRAGLGVYRSLGFEVVQVRRCWVSAAVPASARPGR